MSELVQKSLFSLCNEVIFLIFQVEPEDGKLQEQRYLQDPQEQRPPEDQGRQGQHPPEDQDHQDLLPKEDQGPQDHQDLHHLEDQGHQEHHRQVPNHDKFFNLKTFRF